MGNYFGKGKSQKRKIIETNQNSPVCKRFRTTFDYLYQNLFIKGEGSDITINAFNKSWNLHKLYICQSSFFASMFSGSWLEKDLKEINLKFSDLNITSDAVNIVLGSFYYDSFELKEENVLNIIATCIWFQLDELQNICEEFVITVLNLKNVVKFYDFSKQYEMPKLCAKCLEWLSCVLLLLDNCKEFYKILQSISSQLMLDLILNPRLFVIQIEQDVFLLLLKWLYLKKFPNVDICNDNLSEIVCSYFKSENLNIDIIDEAPNVIYKLFEAIRWEHIITTSKTAFILEEFSIIPKDILMSAYKKQWINMLMSSESESCGPPVDLESEIFWKYSERCGRTILKDICTIWRWSTYTYDIDIIIRYINREFYIIRFYNHEKKFNFVKNTTKKRKLKFHFTIASYRTENHQSINNFPIILDRIESGLLSLELLDNIPIKILSLPINFKFPLILSANFLRCNPFFSNDSEFQKSKMLCNSTEQIISM